MFLSVSEVPLLLVFTERHQMSRIKTVRQFKSKIWEMKGGKYAKSLAKIQGSAIFQKQDIRIIHCPNLSSFVWRRHVGRPSEWAPTWRPETNRNSCYWVFLLKREFISRGTHKHKSNTFFNTTVPIAKSPKIGHFLTLMTALLAAT